MNSRLIDEICVVGKLEPYRDTIAAILITIHNQGCKVSTRYDVGYSNIEQNIETGYIIRVSLNKNQQPLDIIWKLLHEYGHFLSGPKLPEDTLIQREELAWLYADKLVQQYADLAGKIEDYNTCRERCLDSYRK